jgi:tetratricopeptide (TPR) repeat protein
MLRINRVVLAGGLAVACLAASPPPASAQSAIQRARTLIQAGQFDQARALLDPLAAGTSPSGEVLLLLGSISEQQGNRDEAAAQYEKAIARAPKLAEAYDRLGFIRGQQGRTGDRRAAARRRDRSAVDGSAEQPRAGPGPTRRGA